MGKIIVHGMDPSPPTRSVLLTLNALGLKYELQMVNLLEAEHLSEEFLKKNPQHTIPVLEDDGVFLWDSHAITAYLVRRYSRNDDLYPGNFIDRATIDQRLHFDSGVLFPHLRDIVRPLLFRNNPNIPQERIDVLYVAYDFLEAFLQHDYMAGRKLTIADFCIVATVTSLAEFAPVDPEKTPKLAAWLDRMAELPYFEKANGKGVAIFSHLVKSKLALAN